MSIVCLAIPDFALHVAYRADPALHERAILLADKRERGRVLALCARSYELGARVGMTLVQAQACAREAQIVVRDDAASDREWSTILDALDAASPLVEDGGPGLAYLEMRGIDGDGAGWLASVRTALAGFDDPVQLGLAANKVVARIAARTAPPGGDRRIAPGDEAATLAPLPLALLEGIADDVRERLLLLGIETLGDLAALPHGPFVRRFGVEAMRWHAWARGVDDEPLVPRAHALRIDRTLYGEGAAASEDQVLFALRTLVSRVVDDLALVGKRCGRLDLTLELDDGETHALRVHVAQPTARESLLFDLVRARLEGLVLTAPVVGLRLAAQRLEDGGVPLVLFASNDPDPEALALALARLDAAFGESAAQRVRVIDAHRDEQRIVRERFDPDAVRTKVWSALPATRTRRTAMQFRLVEPREIDVVVRGGLPRFVGTPSQAVVDLAGPWRSDAGWWQTPIAPNGRVRDEYDVALADGALVRIAHEGERWMLRGVYD